MRSAPISRRRLAILRFLVLSWVCLTRFPFNSPALILIRRGMQGQVHSLKYDSSSRVINAHQSFRLKANNSQFEVRIAISPTLVLPENAGRGRLHGAGHKGQNDGVFGWEHSAAAHRVVELALGAFAS